MRRIGCFETSVTDYHSTLRNIPDDRKCQEIGLMKIHVNGKMILKWTRKVQWRSFAMMTHSLKMRLAPRLEFIKQSNIICHLQYCFIYGYRRELLCLFQCKSRQLDGYMKIQYVPLATETGISLIILTPMKTQMVATSSTCYDVVTFLTQLGKFASNFVVISSLVVKLLKKCRVR
jgi:hypothetical protein